MCRTSSVEYIVTRSPKLAKWKAKSSNGIKCPANGRLTNPTCFGVRVPFRAPYRFPCVLETARRVLIASSPSTKKRVAILPARVNAGKDASNREMKMSCITRDEESMAVLWVRLRRGGNSVRLGITVVRGPGCGD